MTCISLFSGSSGNCLFVREGQTRLLVDAGGSLRRIERALAALGESLSSVSAVLFTHEHSDHTAAVAQLVKKTDCALYFHPACAEEVYLSLCRAHPAEADAFCTRVRTINEETEYELGELCVRPFSLPHDSVFCLGFRFESLAGAPLLGIATDLGHVPQQARRALMGCPAVVLESNHDPVMLEHGPYPLHLQARIASEHGHLSNPDCAALLSALAPHGTRRALLFHLSADNNHPDCALSCAREVLGESVAVSCAARDEVTPLCKD